MHSINSRNYNCISDVAKTLVTNYNHALKILENIRFSIYSKMGGLEYMEHLVFSKFSRSWGPLLEPRGRPWAPQDLENLEKHENTRLSYFPGPPLKVQCDFYIQNIGSINAVDMVRPALI